MEPSQDNMAGTINMIFSQQNFATKEQNKAKVHKGCFNHFVLIRISPQRSMSGQSSAALICKNPDLEQLGLLHVPMYMCKQI